jgi:hypothetical protein
MIFPTDHDPEPLPEPRGAFMLVPACFWQNLSPDQFKAQQQIYQTAYERARQKLGTEADNGEISFDI